MNKLAKANSHPENKRPGFPGEKHAFIWTTKGFVRANYEGPGTHTETRIKRGDKPISYSDAVSQAHDIRYSFATSNADIRAADKKMIDSMTKGQELRLDFPGNLLVGKTGIQIKSKVESLTGKTFIKPKKKPSTSPAMKSKLKELETKGLGTKKKKKKKKGGTWLQHVAKFRRDNPDVPNKEVFAAASKTFKKSA